MANLEPKWCRDSPGLVKELATPGSLSRLGLQLSKLRRRSFPWSIPFDPLVVSPIPPG